MPSARVPIRYEGYTINSKQRENNFEVMLTVIEENSGHMITLATVEWGKSFRLQYDCKKAMHSRISMTEVESFCTLNESQF